MLKNVWTASCYVHVDGSADVLFSHHTPGQGWKPAEHVHGYTAATDHEIDVLHMLVESLRCRLLALEAEDL